MDRNTRRLLAVALAVLVLAASACQVARPGRRCRGGVARDATHVLVCQRGRWVRVLSFGQLAQLVAARRSAEPAFEVSVVAAGLGRPWDVAFLPDGTPLVTERSGRLVAVRGGGRQVLAAPADVEAVGEGGLMGLAVDPGFASNRRVYVCLRSTAGGSSDVRVSRWELDAGVTTVVGRSDIVTGIPAGSTHVGCRVRFGPDGYLWVSTGDANLGPGPQSPVSLAGKVLRVSTDGAGAPGNPGGALDPRVYTLGHRNPQGLAFRIAPGTAEDGRPYAVEHGPTVDDEVNRLVPGGNYGWNPIGPGGSYNQAVPMTAAGAVAASWSSGSPTVAPSGATFVSGLAWGAWDGALVVANLKASRLQVLRLSADGASVEAQWLALGDRGRLRSVVQGPGGSLYVVTDADDGALVRLTPR